MMMQSKSSCETGNYTVIEMIFILEHVKIHITTVNPHLVNLSISVKFNHSLIKYVIKIL